MNAKDSMISDLNARLEGQSSAPPVLQSNENLTADTTEKVNRSDLDDVTRKLAEQRRELDLVISEKQSLETSLEELDAQHTAALAQIVASRNELAKASDALRCRVSELERDLAHSEKKSTFVSDDVAQRLRVAEEKELNLLSLISGVKSELDIAKRHNVEAENKMASLSRKSDERVKEATAEQERDLRARITATEEKLVEESEKESVLLQRISTLEGQVREFKLSSAEATNEIQKLHAEESANQEQAKQFEQSKAELMRLESENARLRIETEKLKMNGGKQLSSDGHDKVVAATTKAVASNDVLVLRGENESLRAKLELVETEARLYETEVDRLAVFEEKYAALLEAGGDLRKDDEGLQEVTKVNKVFFVNVHRGSLYCVLI